MIYKLENPTVASSLFQDCDDTIVLSCLQGTMGDIYADSLTEPSCAVAYLSCFAIFTGIADPKLLDALPGGYTILVPGNESWETLFSSLQNLKKSTRYSIKKEPIFNRIQLQSFVLSLPDGYELRQIDRELYYRCLETPDFEDFVSAFDNEQDFSQHGLGFVVLKDGDIVSGASSFSRYIGGIEVEVDTLQNERRKHLALAACARLILECLDRGLKVTWDAHNMASVCLAQKLGYELSHEYTVFIGELS